MTLDQVPNDIKSLPQWVCCWSGSKVPMRAWEPEPASSSNPDTWSPYETARGSVEAHGYDYAGFVFHDNGIVGIDIDKAFDESGLLTSETLDILRSCHSYTERSRSGRGFHILVKGRLPFSGRNNLAGVEIYQSGRYFIMTGDVFQYSDLVENQEAIDYILDEYFSDISLPDQYTKQTSYYKPVWPKPGKRIRFRPDYPPIDTGNRNLCLTSLAGSLHTSGYPKAEIYRELLRANAQACSPPLDEYEVQSIVNSVIRYER